MFEYFKNIFDSYRNRLKNPILGAYSISFILCNWRPILILISSSKNIEDKIEIINLKYSFPGAILWPLLVTFIITIVLPYLMVAAEYIVSRANGYRINSKRDATISDYDHRIVIASKEYDIQSKKSGTRTVEMLQSNIEILESDKKNILEQLESHKLQYEENIDNLKILLSNEKEKNESKDTNVLEIKYSVFDVFRILESSGKLEEFRFNYNYFFSTFGLNDLQNYYANLGLLSKNGEKYLFTELSDQLYYLLFELYTDSVEKKDLFSIVKKLNKHERSVFRAVEKIGDPIRLNSFNQQVVMMLEQGYYIKPIKESPNMQLTAKGFVMRNIIGYLNDTK